MRSPALLAATLIAACASPAPPPPRVAPPPAPAPVPPPPPSYPPPAFRLPDDVAPIRARVELTIVPDAATARGHVGFDAEVRRPTRVVWLHATGLTIAGATLGGAAARVVPGTDAVIGLTLDHELPAGPLAIAVDFTAPIDHERSRGLYAEREGADAYAYTFFEATDARRAFPCFDEPAAKIPWQLTFHVRRDHVALGNAPVTAEADEPDGMKRVTLAESAPLPSYLVAFVVGPFELVDAGVAGRAHTPIRFVIPKGRGGELGYAKAVTPKIVTALEDYFDMPYPFRKLDVAVVPRFWGTMEHPGLLAMGQPLTLIRPEQATRERREAYTNIAAHELSHYWFGDYVTLGWWDDTWLNEAAGEWLDAIITAAVEPTWRFDLERVLRTARALSADETLASQRIRQPVTSPQDIEAAFDGEITYLKGSSVLRMFEAAAGPDAWRAVMRAYVRAHAFGTAHADDLFAALGAALGPDVAAGVRSFVDQPGAPRITLRVACGDKSGVVLHQERALPLGVADPAPRPWTVPVCVRYGTAHGGSQRACTTLATADGALPLAGCPTWLVPNADGAGYYRSDVSDVRAAAQLLVPGSPAARAAQPTPAEKLMLVADLRAAVARDEYPLDAALGLAPKVIADPDPAVARAAGALAAFTTAPLDDALYARARAYELRTWAPLARQLGWARRAGDSDDTHALRRQALAGAHEDAQIGATAATLALKWLDDPRALDDDLVTVALGIAAERGDAALFDRILAKVRAPRDRTERQRVVMALGQFRAPALLARALDLTLAPDLDLRDTISIVKAALDSRETRAAALAFLEAHLDALLARMRDDEAGWLLTDIAAVACDPDTHARVAALVTPRAATRSGATAAVTHTLAQGDACSATFTRQLPALRAFLTAQR